MTAPGCLWETKVGSCDLKLILMSSMVPIDHSSWQNLKSQTVSLTGKFLYKNCLDATSGCWLKLFTLHSHLIENKFSPDMADDICWYMDSRILNEMSIRYKRKVWSRLATEYSARGSGRTLYRPSLFIDLLWTYDFITHSLSMGCPVLESNVILENFTDRNMRFVSLELMFDQYSRACGHENCVYLCNLTQICSPPNKIY